MILNLAFVTVVGAAAFIGLQSIPEPKWATLSELHAEWQPDTRTVSLSLMVNKRMTCQATPIAKFLTPLSGNDVLSQRIPVNGKISQKLQALPLGRASVFDVAKPRAEVTPGEYLLSLTASCELPPAPSGLADEARIPPSPQLLASNELTIRVVVP
jgi:hypothetical protein